MNYTVSKASWEKQTIYILENGWVLTEEHNQCYGYFVKSLRSPQGKVWLACNGDRHLYYNEVFKTDKYIALPDFAAGWKETKFPELVRFDKSFYKRIDN